MCQVESVTEAQLFGYIIGALVIWSGHLLCRFRADLKFGLSELWEAGSQWVNAISHYPHYLF